MKNIEYEERVLISKDDYEKVIADIQLKDVPLTKLKIENIYLDNDDSFIESTKKMLRIRTINGVVKELTLKIKNEDNSNIEINENLEDHPQIDAELNGPFEDYKEVARLITDRFEANIDDYLLVIDKNEYHGTTDYNIEIEAKSQAKAREIMEIYCKKYKIKYDPHTHSKSHRAIKRAKELRKKNEM